MKKITGKLSLQWRLTLITALLMTVTCILMYFFISQSAVAGMEDLGDYMIRIDNTDSAPVTFNMNPSVLFPELSNQLQLTKKLFLTKGLMVTGIIILLSSICTYFISRQALLPLRRLSQEVNKIEAQNLSKTLEVPATNDEISRLTISFNKMLARLDEAFTAQKQFSANAAHELRTPLAVIQTNLEVFARREAPALKDYQEIFAMLQEQTGRLSHLAEILLDMTGVQTVERSERISLAALTDEVFCDLDPVAEKAGISIHFDDSSSQDWHTDVHTPDASALNNNIRNITGSYVLLYRAVYNLVENAIKYNRPNGSVTVSVKEKNGQAMILVKDTGIGISPENQKKIFDPFFRVDKSRSRAMGGAGLGLALVDSIAKEHGGSVKVLESNEKGSIIALMLPVSSSKN
mgnify:CR=1 FL=1